ncbi:MAG: GntR family transcriptional regulator [Planctomycetia bacterium]|nr:GntR family transcriptional regulator [Planctomycetia bacterium]
MKHGVPRATGRRAVATDLDGRGDPLFRASERFSLDERSPVPLYHQVEQIILDRIAKAGEIGLKVPREMDLIKIFNVSRATVKKATDSLAAKGLIERNRSAGTRIVRLNVTEDLGRLTSFSEQMQSRNLRASTEILGVELHMPEAAVAEALRLSKTEKTLCIRRLRGTSEAFPVVLLRSEIPAAFGIDPREDFHTSLYDIIETKYRIPIEWADQKIWAGQATAAEAKLLRIKPGDTVLGMERITYTRSDRPLEYVKAIYRPEHYTFSMRLKR